ncbi:hypothetical protein LSTR_LSTR002858 [Laodelphax striatellus]|uniref:Uncharacterized protein n=1 Tax=Laodelphax striatellus TaxID=195883 RepID=A0A482XHA8_LAOST|nr:hypothetical protein LSTR_LSTR002858 [Laodelphax striatellus]
MAANKITEQQVEIGRAYPSREKRRGDSRNGAATKKGEIAASFHRGNLLEEQAHSSRPNKHKISTKQWNGGDVQTACLPDKFVQARVESEILGQSELVGERWPGSVEGKRNVLKLKRQSAAWHYLSHAAFLQSTN